MEIPVPFGDVIDKITILRIKSRRISDPEKNAHVRRELSALQAHWAAAGLADPVETDALERVNEDLWEVEDMLRRHEAASDFGDEFVARARWGYHLNDERARLKRAINLRLGSPLVEQKEYVNYGASGVST